MDWGHGILHPHCTWSEMEQKKVGKERKKEREKSSSSNGGGGGRKLNEKIYSKGSATC